VYNKKFSNKIHNLESFLTLLFRMVKIIETPPEDEASESEGYIRDLDDRPILRAALKFDVDILITGDRDFLESGLTRPHIVKPADFLNINAHM
ncbi:MAG: PIN domain-containing protein, partial [Clostridiales bacterium]|nr:PIN domain-containing protein [Clostridiales bacterium]